MGETQREIVETIKELKSSVSKPSEECERPPQKESAAGGKGYEQKGPSFVTQEDVIAMLEKELSQSQEDWKYIPQPLYPSSLLQQPYPKGYEAPSFVLFKGRKGSPKEHVNRYIDAFGPHAGDHNLRLREFSKSLTDCAYTWYTILAPGSICFWEDLASRIYCSNKKDEEALVEIRISNVVADYRVYLENIGIS
ncbi:unnamed protein product [Prunus brigantina]